ncbi:MAG: response regulator [Bacteroidetes bacterium]|nr:response regulator [Bacteroidota bacterium]
MSKTIFIVDDEEGIRDIFETILKIFYRDKVKAGELQIVKSEDGAAAVANAGKLIPDLILMDVKMPKMDGIEAFYAIRDLNSGHPVKTFFITGFASDGEIGNRMNQAIRDGALGMLPKPVSSPDLKKLVDDYLSP